MTENARNSAAPGGTTPAAPLSVEAAHHRLCEVEQQMDLLRHTVDGWSAWPVLRFEASQIMFGASFPHRHTVSRFERTLRALNDVPALIRPRRSRHLVKTYSSGLLEKAGDRYRDIRFDDVVLAAGSTYKIEVVTNPGFSAQSRRALVSRDLSSTVLELGAAILARRRPSADVATIVPHLSRALRDGLGLPLDDQWVTWRLQRFSATRRVYAALLRRVRPSFVLVADSGEHALVAAAKERGSVVLELQHGINDSTHAGYAWPAAAGRYRPIMPVPDRLLLYGEHWRSELASGFWGDSLRVVGSPRIDRYRSEPPVRATDRCTVLVTTQGFEVERVAAFLAMCVKQIGERVPLRLVVKLHPLYETDKQPYLNALSMFGDRVEVLAGGEGASTFEWLRRAHLHASIASASHYDAIGLGVPTVVLPFKTHEVVLPLYRAGHAYLARTPEDLAELLLDWRSLHLPQHVSEYYFKSGARANILRELDLPVEESRS